MADNADIDRPDWWREAACRGLDPTVMFPYDGVGVEAAKAVCRGCDVRETCLEYALERREAWGIWGGTSERERRRIRRRRAMLRRAS